MTLGCDDALDGDLLRIIHRAYREAVQDGVSYDTATAAALRAVMAVYPEWSRDDAMDQILRLGSGPY